MGNAAISLTALDASWEFWSQVLPTRQTDPRTTRRLLIGQRIHERDVPGRWIESDPDVQVVCLPLHYDPDHPYAHQHDPREPGELLWPERMPESEVEDLRRTLGPVHAEAQLEQRPVPVGGGVFKRDWVRFWTRLPERLEVVDSWDMTFGATGQSSSWVVGQKWGRSGADRYLIDQTRGRVEYPAMRDMLRTFSAKKPVASVKLVEDKAAGKPIVQDLRGEIHGLIEVKVTGASGGKLARAQATTGQWEAGNVYLPHPTDAMLPDGTLHPCPWVHDLIERLCTFRGVPGDVADEVDAMSQVLNRWESHGSYVDDWKKALKS
jgi:predicted phage terminase large subunit-like protein